MWKTSTISPGRSENPPPSSYCRRCQLQPLASVAAHAATHLALQDPFLQLLAVDPLQAINDADRGEHPPGVADLPWSAVYVWRRRRLLTSGSFSGLPFRPPSGSWRSASHQPSKSASTRSALPTMARAPTQQNAVAIKVRASSSQRTCSGTYSGLHVILPQAHSHRLHQSSCTCRATPLPSRRRAPPPCRGGSCRRVHSS